MDNQNNRNLFDAATMWHHWNEKRLEAAKNEMMDLADYDLLAAVTALYRKQLEYIISQAVKDQAELDIASDRLAEEIAELLGTK